MLQLVHAKSGSRPQAVNEPKTSTPGILANLAAPAFDCAGYRGLGCSGTNEHKDDPSNDRAISRNFYNLDDPAAHPGWIDIPAIYNRTDLFDSTLIKDCSGLF